MTIDKETVQKVAGLARIKVTDAEQEKLAPQLSHIIGWIEQLSEVNTDNVEPLANVVDITPPLRKDEVTDGGYPADVLANAPEELEGFFVVPKVIE